MKKLKKRRKKDEKKLFLVFCVSVSSFCADLTVVFCSVCSFVRFLLILIKRGRDWVCACWVLFPSSLLDQVWGRSATKKPRKPHQG